MAEPNEYKCGFCGEHKVKERVGKRARTIKISIQRPCDRCALPVIIHLIGSKEVNPDE